MHKFSSTALAEYQDAGAELNLKWPIIAAADSIGTGIAPEATDSDRIMAIAYSLQSMQAAANYEAALTDQGGPSYAKEVLRLAARLTETSVPTPEPTNLPLDPPTDGPVIAAYGQKFGVLHDGLDFDAETGTPLRAAADGVVLSTSQHPIFGLYTCLQHRLEGVSRSRRDLVTCYGNQSAVDVSPGERVQRGQTIGAIGCTGTCLRPHVHFQVRIGADPDAPAVDPAPFMPAEIEHESKVSGQPLETQP